MSLRNKRIMWKALDGREFIVDTSDCNTMKDVQKKINILRKKHEYEDPTFMSVQINDPAISIDKDINVPHIDDIENPALKEKVKKTIEEGISKPDPKTLN